jgi:DNA-binding transcriptional MerR regulator
MTSMKISGLAQRTGLTPDTIRFYEKSGLLDDTQIVRGENGYRYYDDSVITRIELIKHGQAAGFTLSEIAQVVSAWQADQVTPDQKIAYFNAKLRQIQQRIAHLQNIHAYLENKLDMFKAELIEGEKAQAAR